MPSFSASDFYKGKQSVDIHLPSYSEGLALHTLTTTANAALRDCDNDKWIEDGIDHHFTIILKGVAVDFWFGPAQCEALRAFIDHLAGENMHYVDPNYEYVRGVL